jgi:hypothetical protein
MQILSSPTREEVDKAHQRNQHLEIGIQSLKNLAHISRKKSILWAVFALGSVPLHLFLNSCIAEAKASTDFTLVVASENFVHGGNFSWPGLGTPWDVSSTKFKLTLEKYAIDHRSYAKDETMAFLGDVAAVARNWDRINLEECFSRYNDPLRSLVSSRHAVMVVSHDTDGTNRDFRGDGWTTELLRKDIPRQNRTSTSNNLWTIATFLRTDAFVADRESDDKRLKKPVHELQDLDAFDADRFPGGMELNKTLEELEHLKAIPDEYNTFASISDIQRSGEISLSREIFDDTFNLTAEYCLSEPFSVNCEIRLHNRVLLIVCLFCVIKAGASLYSTLRFVGIIRLSRSAMLSNRLLSDLIRLPRKCAGLGPSASSRLQCVQASVGPGDNLYV